MTRRILQAMALAALACLPAHAQAPASGVDSLAWVAGCWSLARPDGVTEEQWMRPAGGALIGMSRTVRGGKMTEHEFLLIRDVGGKPTYIAKPSGQPEASFPMLRSTATEVVFENAAHDFPQRVIYRKNADGGLTARIEGTMNGQARGIDFPYKPCR